MICLGRLFLAVNGPETQGRDPKAVGSFFCFSLGRLFPAVDGLETQGRDLKAVGCHLKT